MLRKCCPSKCGEHCGTENCNKHLGASNECCFIDIPDNVLCGVEDKKAPCSLGKISPSLFLLKPGNQMTK